MPFQSRAQVAWMFANKPAMAKKWASHTSSIKSLPKKVKQKSYSKGAVQAALAMKS